MNAALSGEQVQTEDRLRAQTEAMRAALTSPDATALSEFREHMAEAWERGHFYCAAEVGDARGANPYSPQEVCAACLVPVESEPCTERQPEVVADPSGRHGDLRPAPTVLADPCQRCWTVPAANGTCTCEGD